MNASAKYSLLTFFLITFFAIRLMAQADITAMEYFIDIDPGVGLATDVPITPGAVVSESFVVPISTLPVGFHTIYFRVFELDSNRWSLSESRSFYVSPTDLTIQADIVAVEYFIDTDPGVGAGTSLPLVAATTVNINSIIPTSALLHGFHTLYIRALDADGVWGESESRSFFIDAATNGKIANIEYFFDNDPGYGNGGTLIINPPKDSIDSVVYVPTGPLALGAHVLGIRLVSDNGLFGITDYYNFAICDGAVADFAGDVVCIGGTTLFTDNSLNVLAGDVYSWDFDGDGFEDSNTSGNQLFTYPAPGVYAASLSINRVGCIGVDTVQVMVENIPVANAGVDQSLCATNAVLEGSSLGANESGVWSIITGTAVIADAADSTSALSNITTNTVELIWAITNTLAGCNDQDTVSIAVNLPISATIVNNIVDIGQIRNVNVQSIAVINQGDILTTSIITMPLYGMANLLADGTIDYIPNLDAASADSLVYRITNQCNNFDDNWIVFTVINSPPVIDNQGVSPPLGSTEISIDLTAIISDVNGNIDFTRITIITQPISGAIASIDTNGMLDIDYRGITFSGTDQLEVEVCDLVGACTVETISITNVEVGGVNPPLSVFNGVSPNGDGFNDFLEIENIEFYPDNTVIILNRWGAEIERLQGYNNQDIIFEDATLPSGTYYYHIIPGVSDVSEVTGHFLLVID